VNIKELIENNTTLSILGLLLAGFVAGIATYGFMAGFGANKSRTNPASCSTQDWQPLARKSDWLPKLECPAYPVSIRINSPGTGSVLQKDYEKIYTDLVIQTSRPLPETNSVGLVINEVGQPNFYVVFPNLVANETRTIFRDSYSVSLPFDPDDGASVSLWAIVVQDRTQFGSNYSSLDQIKSSGSDVTISQATNIKVTKR
jgi:hypothetical protein